MKKLLTLFTLLLCVCSGAWGEMVSFVGGTASGQINVTSGDGSQELSSTPVTINIVKPGAKSQNRQIWKDGSTAKNEYAFQLSSGAGDNYNTKYVEISVASGYKITGVTLRAAANGTTAGTVYGYCFEGAFSTETGAVKAVGSFAVPGNGGTSDGANVAMTGIVDGTRTIRIYKQVKYDSETNTINGTDGSSNPSTAITVCIASITVTYEASAPAGITLTNVVNEDGWGTVSPVSVENIVSGTVPLTSSNTYTVGATVVTATPADASAEYTYSFSSWSGLPASVTESATVTANFARTPNSYTLAWNTNGGSELAGDYTSGSIAYGTTITAPSDPTRDGYVFVGWNTANDGSGDDYAGTMPAATTTFYAQWMKPAEDIDFNEHVKTFEPEATSKDFSLLETKNYVYELAGNTCFDNSANAPYQGLKMKNSGDYILFLAESGKNVKFTFGFVNTKPTVTIDGVVQPAISVSTGNGYDNQEVTFAANHSNRIFKLTTADGNSMVIKKIEFLTPDARTATTTEITSVSIDALNKDLANGTTGGTLAATVTPEGGDALSTPAIAWTSSNTGVAEINETTGAVTLVAEGTTTITATYAGDVDYKGSADTYVLTVVDNTSSLTAESNKLWKVGDTNWKTDNIEYTDGFGDPSGDSRDIDGINLPKSTKVTSASTSVNTHIKIANNTTVVVYGRGNSSSATTANLYVGNTSGEPVATASWSNDKLYKVAYTNTSGSEQDIYFCGLDNQYRLSGIWVMPNAVDVAITTVGYASFATTYPMNFNESGITAYIATENGTESVAMTEVTNVPANTGVILKGTSASIPVLGATAADATTGNLLKPGEKTVTEGEATAGTIYAFGKKGEQVGFVRAAADYTIVAGKAYLDLSDAAAKGADFISFVFGNEEENETTGINAVSTAIENGVRYNLAGQKVGKNYKGIVIVNGKKMLNK